MRAGELRNRIVIQQNTPTRDGFNALVDSWSTFATLWAKVETLSGGETVQQQQATALLSHRFTVRKYPGLTPKMRVSWNSRVFDILAVIDDNVNRQIQLACNEVIRG